MDKPSKKFTLNYADLKAQGKSALIFLAPKIISVIAILTPQAKDIFPDPQQRVVALGVMTWVADQLTGLLRRYQAGQ